MATVLALTHVRIGTLGPLFASPLVSAQRSVVHADTAVDALHGNNRFFHRTVPNATQLEELVFGTDATDVSPSGSGSSNASCAHDIQLAWTTKLESSVYASPLIMPSGPQGGQSVWSGTFVRTKSS